MGNWRERLADIDDDYLIGISNKGILKRAYKDKGESAAEVQSLGDEAEVKVGEEVVTVRFPLEESKCTCPSRSICRHVVQAILVLRERTGEGNLSLEKESGQVEATKGTAASEKVLHEMEEYPLAALKKALGIRQLQTFVSQVLSGVKPRIQYASVVTVYLPGRTAGAETVVRLLSPLEYSSCTCHKKELCAHKAAAILWCRLETGKLAMEDLTGGTEESSYDMDRVREAAGQMQRFLEELLGTGLSRTSPDVLDHMERLAVISHNVGLAAYEGWFRGLFDSYDSYFKRKSAFKTEELMGRLTRLYRRVKLLRQAKDDGEVRQYAGEFRAEYIPVGSLDLIGIAMEHFDSGTGYEGETVYFLEEHTKKWYTYTNARPVFYEKGRNRKFTGKAQAPWGLGISMEELSKVRISLTGAKCDERNRLSSSQDTRGEATGEQRLALSDIEGWYYRDFGKLFTEQIGKRRKEWLAVGGAGAAELVFVQPDSWEPADFSQAGQQLFLPLYDGEGREVTIEVAYSKEEAGTIRYLERISKGEPPCMVGKIYLKNGKLRMYPVAVQNTLLQG